MDRQIDIFDPLRDLPRFVDRRSRVCKTYAGIGSRETPEDVCRFMTRIARWLEARHHLVLRSGGAKGADTAFERGTIGPKQIFLPWNGFNGRTMQRGLLVANSERAYDIAKKHHPKWYSLSDLSKAMHARNTHQLLGATCEEPSAFVVCWTPDGSIGKTTSKTGGTGQAIRIAHAYGIPVFNLQRDDHRATWEAFVGT
jgi:hypothetical protein